MACFIFKQLIWKKTITIEGNSLIYCVSWCYKHFFHLLWLQQIIKWWAVSLSGCSLPVSRGLQLGLQPLGPLRLIPQWLEELADGHLLAVDPRCRHAQVKAFAALRTTHIANAIDTSVLGGIVSVRSQTGINISQWNYLFTVGLNVDFKC